jgi:acyl-CoA thioesterase-1
MPQIFVFGDSISYGAWDLEGGYVQRLRRWLDKRVIDSNYKEYFIVHNLGVGGDTSEGVLKRIESEAQARIFEEDDEEIITLIQIGANDCIFHNASKKHKISPEKYEDNLNQIIKKARVFSDKILFVGDTPINDKILDPIPWYSKYSFLSKDLKNYMEIARKVCKENNVLFVDVQGKLNKEEFIKLLTDGSHPNSKGHEKVFEIVRDCLIENKIV